VPESVTTPSVVFTETFQRGHLLVERVLALDLARDFRVERGALQVGGPVTALRAHDLPLLGELLSDLISLQAEEIEFRVDRGPDRVRVSPTECLMSAECVRSCFAGLAVRGGSLPSVPSHTRRRPADDASQQQRDEEVFMLGILAVSG